MNLRLASFALGAVVGLAASLARAPLAGQLCDGPVVAPLASGVWRAAPIVALALGLVLVRRARTPQPLALVLGVAAGFGLHALLLSPWVAISSSFGLGGVCAATVAAVWLALRDDGAQRAQPEPSGLRIAGLALASAGATVALEVAARPLRQFGSSADEQTVYALAFVACLAVGALAFAGLFVGERARSALPVVVVAAALGVWVSLATLSEIRTREGLDTFLRTALFGLVELDLSRRAMLDADFLIAARVLVVPAFAWGAALACVRHPHELAGLALGAGIALVCGPALAANGAPIDAESLALAANATLEPLVSIAAAGAALALAVERRFVAAGVAAALALVGWTLPARPTLVITPWERFPTQPRLWVDHPLGLLTVEPTLEQDLVVTLDRRRVTAVGAAVKAEEAQVATMWRALALPNQGVRVLLIGQLSPQRAQVLGAFGAARIDRTGAWSDAMPALEEALFEGAARPAGEILAPHQVTERGDGAWDLVWMPATDGAVFDLPRAPFATTPVAVWQPIDAWVADRHLDPAPLWTSGVLLAGDGLDQVAFGCTSGAGWNGEQRGVERLAASARITPPTLLERARSRAFQREFDAQVAALRRLVASDEGSRLARALLAYYELQVRSSPFETHAQQIELDVEVLNGLREVASASEPGLFLRRTWDWLAAVLVGKREVEWILSYVEPLAQRYPGWAALERALGAAYAEALDPATAAVHLERALAVEPFDLTQYAPAAEAHILAGAPERAVDLLRKGLEIQPQRRDWQRLLGIALVRSGDRSGREILQDLLLEDPDDEALIPYLGDPPYPEFVPTPVSGGPHDH